MQLPILIHPAIGNRVCAAEEMLMDLAGGMAGQGLTGPVADHHAAVRLANELLWAHESANPADALLHQAASQLKCWHLNQLANVLAKI